jgi:glyoxylase-like metal-dependent hydrolase (beta-lactamase superfamily II)
LAVLVCGLLPRQEAQAEAPQARTNAPGFYRILLGQFEITALSDGTIDLNVTQLMTNTTPRQAERALARYYLRDPVRSSVNAYLVNTGSKLVLIDAGAAKGYAPTLGKLIDNLRSSGYRPEQVDAVLITHMHGDHIGGIADGDRPVFPNAVVHAERREADYWLDPAKMAKAPAEARKFFEGAMAAVGPYAKAGKFRTFEGTSEIVPGIRARPARGHTAGHTVFEAESGAEKMAFWGDLMHVAAIQFDDPSVTIRFDTDSKAAAEQRRKEFAQAAKQGYRVAVAHVSFPGIGRLRAEGKGYRWIPVNYEPLR